MLQKQTNDCNKEKRNRKRFYSVDELAFKNPRNVSRLSIQNKNKKLSQKSLHCIYVCRPLKSEPFHELFMKNHRSFVIYVMQYKQRMVPNIWIRVVSNLFFSLIESLFISYLFVSTRVKFFLNIFLKRSSTWR